jgi:DNA-directed RNA polymerase beta' subunit
MTTMDLREIKKVEFGILSPEEIKNMAVCKIDSTKLTGPGTIYDERMGCITDTNIPCVTCGLKKECWGHFGYIDLAVPILHPMYYKMITSFLKCFCKKCHRLLLLEEQIELAGLTRYKYERRFDKILEKLEKVDICSHEDCLYPQPKVSFKSKDMIIALEYKQKKKAESKEGGKISIILEVDEIKKIFDNIIDSDVALLGFDPKRVHPKNFIMTVFPVIPPCSRPYVISDGGNICDDDLTYQLLEIVKTNQQLLKKEDEDMKKKSKLIQSLKFRISTTFNNSKGKSKHPTDSRAIKGLKERLAGKDGQVRNNHMGDETGRVCF